MDHVEEYYYNKKFEEDDLKLFYKLDQERDIFRLYKNIYITLLMFIFFIFCFYSIFINTTFENWHFKFNDTTSIIFANLILFCIYYIIIKLIITEYRNNSIQSSNEMNYSTQVYVIMVEKIKRYCKFLDRCIRVSMHFSLLAILLLICSFFMKYNMIKAIQMCFLITISILIYNYMSKYMRSYVFFKLIKDFHDERKEKEKKTDHWFKALILKFISPDFHYAKVYKEKLKMFVMSQSFTSANNHYEDSSSISIRQWDVIKILQYFYLIFSNWANLIASLAFAVVLMIISSFNFFPHFLVKILIILFMLRGISRTFEIICSFYSDVVNKKDILFTVSTEKILKFKLDPHPIYIHNWKDSFLLKGNRLSLAVHSLLEILVLYSIIYPFFTDKCNTIFNWNISKWGEGFFHSILITTMNLEKFSNQSICFQIITIAQLITVLVLVVFSIASYLGNSDELHSRERKLFESYNIWKRQRNGKIIGK